MILLKYKNFYKLFFIWQFLIFNSSCSNNHFIIYTIDGERIYDSQKSRTHNFSFKLYFDRKDINYEFDEINIIATDNFYYGQFFFDKVFMRILENQVQTLNADAVIYEKDRIDYPNYTEGFLYFTAIKYKNK